MNGFFEFTETTRAASELALRDAETVFGRIDALAEHNQRKVLAAFVRNRVDETDFAPTTGYGYNDKGREKLDRLLADIFGCEDALIRAATLTCGTHALAVALWGVLRPGDVLLCVTGTPYDTLHSVVGIGGRGAGQGTLADFGVRYAQVDLTEKDELDYAAIEREAAGPGVRMVYIQRSRGYSLRHSISTAEIERVCAIVRRVNGQAVVMVDNCYGEFTERREPAEAGADLFAGSLIKNPGGGAAPCGGYIAGRRELVELCSYRLTSPGLGRGVGPSLGCIKDLYLGLFHAPHVTGEALKTAVFAAALFSRLGFRVTPAFGEERHDIVEAVCLENADRLIAFCQGMQKGAPVDSFVTPIPWPMPGYGCPVIMSAGAFISGSSIELSADAPLREPYAVWMQGGLNFHSGKVGVMLAADEIVRRGLL